MADLDEQLIADVTIAVNDFRQQLRNIGTLSDHEQHRIADAAQALVDDVQRATLADTRRRLAQAKVL